jgi:hypothetical protein
VGKQESKQLLDSLQERLCEPAPVEPPDWRDFIKRFLFLNRGTNDISATPGLGGDTLQRIGT